MTNGAAAEALSGAMPAANGLPPPPSQAARALLDIMQGARAVHLWGPLGWQDIRKRYRRSILGPFWLTISMGMLVGMLGMLYGALFQAEISRFMPFLALGFIFWTLISGMIADSCRIFINAQGIIEQIDLPLSVHVYRMVWHSLIVLSHNILIFVPIAVAFLLWPGWMGLLVLPGLALLCLNGVWAGLLLGLVSVRFRDVPPVVDSVMRIAFFVTPIIWMPEHLPERFHLHDWNPFYHFLELVRAPLLGAAPRLVSWLVVVGATCLGWAATIVMYSLFRRRIAYWV